MHDLRADLSNLWRAAARMTSAEGGRTILFVSAKAGEGTSSVAASFALIAAEKSPRSTWLVDLDLRRNAAYRAFEEGFAANAGVPGRAFDASLGRAPPYSVSEAAQANGEGNKLLTAHQVQGTRLLVTRFRNERLRPGQRVQLRAQPGWWSTVRQAADWVVVDAPALERSDAALAVASQMDGVVVVVRADKTRAEDVATLRMEIEAHGGKVVGVVMNRMRADARLADRISG